MAPSRMAALNNTENIDDIIPNIYLNTQFPLKVISKLAQQIKNNMILLRKINAHSGMLCKGYTLFIVPEG